MDLDPKLVKQLIETFQLELEEQLQVIVDGLLALETDTIDAAARQATLDGVFRAAHNIKGAARGVEVLVVAEIAHHLESLLSVLRQANRRPDRGQIDLCLESLDRMRDAMNASLSGEPVGFDPEALQQRLDQAVTEAGIPVDEPAEGSSMASAQPPPAVAGKHVKTENEAKTAPATAEAPPAPLTKDSGARQLESIRVAADRLDRISALGEELQIAKIEMDDHFTTVHALQQTLTQFARAWARSFGQIRRKTLNQLPADSRQLLAGSLDTIEELESLVKRTHKQMRGTVRNMEFLSTTLRNDVRTLRMVPASTLVRPLARTVRDIARELGKEISLEIAGDELEIDRIVLDGVHDPLVHLLRNAIDHGLEDAATRAAQGKPASGHIRLTLRNEGSQAVIEIADDGAGIDVAKVVRTAIKRRLISSVAAEDMSEQDRLHLIFRPGFSTKEIITNLSGRGFGLDVVQTNLRKLKGSLAVATVAGRGTTFTLRLPFTLSAEHGLIVRAGGRELAIPITSLERVMELTQEMIVDVEASQAISVKDQPVPLRDLASVLGLATTEPVMAKSIPVIVVSRGWRSVALVVEAIVGEREIVIKPLRPPLYSVRNVAGATVTGSGDIIMVLNVGDLVETALSADVRLRSAFAKDREAEVKKPQVLVVDDSITTRTLERSILETRGYAVTLANDGKEAWETLQTREFDLIVTDLEMPLMNGFDLTARIKQSDKYRDIPVIIVTSLATDADKQRGIDAGADAYIVKSQFETKALLDVVQQLI